MAMPNIAQQKTPPKELRVMNRLSQPSQGLSAFALKCIAMLAMTADHVAWVFVDVDTWLSEGLHFVGRLVAPLMVYFLVVGYYHTRDVKAYALRLLVFACISQVPYWLMTFSVSQVLAGLPLVDYLAGNVLFTLFFALLALVVCHGNWSFMAKCLAIAALYPVVFLMDYGFSLVAMALLFAYFYPNKNAMLIAYVVSCPVFYVLTYGFNQTVGFGVMHFGVLLTAVLIYYYNGNKGLGFGGRYLFYWFYPVHMLVIALLAYGWQVAF